MSRPSTMEVALPAVVIGKAILGATTKPVRTVPYQIIYTVLPDGSNQFEVCLDSSIQFEVGEPVEVIIRRVPK